MWLIKHHCLGLTGIMPVCSMLFVQHRLATVSVATPMISHHLKQESELFLIIVDQFDELLHKGYTLFCIVICDTQLVDNCSALPVIISLCHVSGSSSKKSQPLCRRLRRSQVFGVTKSSKLCYEAWLAVKVIRSEPGDLEWGCFDCLDIIELFDLRWHIKIEEGETHLTFW